jgi:hypothetical protein
MVKNTAKGNKARAKRLTLSKQTLKDLPPGGEGPKGGTVIGSWNCGVAPAPRSIACGPYRNPTPTVTIGSF